jgi:hypothetical protein
MTTPPPEQIELHRDRMWRHDEDRRIESAASAEDFIEDVGFANTLTDALFRLLFVPDKDWVTSKQ